MAADTPEKTLSKEEIILALGDLTKEPGFLYSYALILRHDLFLPADEVADINWRERLSFQELTFLGGLLIQNKVDFKVLPSEQAAMEQIGKTYDLFEKLHQAHNRPFFTHFNEQIKTNSTPEQKEATFGELFGSAEMMMEPIFYAGSGAYDFQYLEFAEIKYRDDEAWLLAHKGITVASMAAIARTLKKIEESKHANLRNTPASFEDACKSALLTFCFSIKDLDVFPTNETQSFIKVFGLLPGSLSFNPDSVGTYNPLDSNPIIILDNDLFFNPVGFNLTKSIYESPFYWMSRDDNYKDEASEHRGKSTEELAYQMLQKIFGEANVYKNVKVQKDNNDLTDIDVLAIAGNKSVIIQAKSKKLTELAKTGNDVKLKSDFEEAIQKAYNQGLTSRNAVITKGVKLADKDGKELHLDESIDDAYIICLTTDDYPAVTHQTEVFLNKTPESPYPLAMSIFDFDILCFYLTDPFEFLYYLRQRVKYVGRLQASCEAVFLAVHLKQKLYPRTEYDGEAFDASFAQLIDANFPAMRGHVPKTPAVNRLHHQWKNQRFNELVAQVKETNQPGFTDAVFFLYDLAGDGADELIAVIEKTKQRTTADKQQHDFSMIFEKGKSGITFVCLPNSPEQMEARLMSVAVSRKYKTRADVWLGLGSMAYSSKIVDAVAFNKEPWVENKELEEISKTILVGGKPKDKNGNKIGRNDPCTCGSGVKWKKCHGK